LLRKIYLGAADIVGDNLKEAILYGSYARGDFDDESDVDIALILDTDRLEAKRYKARLVQLMSELSLSNDILICISCIPNNEFEQYKSVLPYYKNIDNEGVRLSA
ncbi:MAG TPA: nucleotidyltransferase domain-containing protein, partial [Anaerovoracaceae bacterium]|nr:nucleotidyltransferase domain-containing protein [Anaerovoracaceae bacterium]